MSAVSVASVVSLVSPSSSPHAGAMMSVRASTRAGTNERVASETHGVSGVRCVRAVSRGEGFG